MFTAEGCYYFCSCLQCLGSRQAEVGGRGGGGRGRLETSLETEESLQQSPQSVSSQKQYKQEDKAMTLLSL